MKSISRRSNWENYKNYRRQLFRSFQAQPGEAARLPLNHSKEVGELQFHFWISQDWEENETASTLITATVSPSFDKVIHVRLKSLPVTENGCRSTLVVEPTFLWMASQDPWIEETCYFTDKVASFLATTNLSPSSRFSLLVVSLFVWTRVVCSYAICKDAS